MRSAGKGRGRRCEVVGRGARGTGGEYKKGEREVAAAVAQRRKPVFSGDERSFS